MNYVLNATQAHPRSTQQLAWKCWANTSNGKPVTLETATSAHDRLVRTIERSEFSAVLNVLMGDDDGEVNEVRALQMLAERGDNNPTSRPIITRYGFSSASRVRPAVERLRRPPPGR